MDVTAAKVERIKVEKDWTKHLLLNALATSQCHLNDFEAKCEKAAQYKVEEKKTKKRERSKSY